MSASRASVAVASPVVAGNGPSKAREGGDRLGRRSGVAGVDRCGVTDGMFRGGTKQIDVRRHLCIVARPSAERQQG